MNTVAWNDPKKPRMIAHRGVSGLEKENTHASFVAAGNRTYFGIETDVHRTADGQYVCIHDSDVARVGLDHLKVEECTYETLRRIRLCGLDGTRGRNDLCIPSLREYIEICRHYEKTAILELKGAFEPAHLAEIAQIIESLGWLDHTVFISFVLDNLIEMRRRYPDRPMQYLVCAPLPAGLPEILNRYRLDLDICHRDLTAELAARVHGDGHEINVWTVNTPDDAQNAMTCSVDYITTNILE